MVALRCTAKLLARIGPPQEPSAPTTTRLGDWYGAPLSLGHKRLILLISEHSRLPVLMAARDTKHLAANFPDALAAVLWGLGIDAAAIRCEVAETREAVIAKTASRSLLGTLNDFGFLLRWQVSGAAELDLVRAAVAAQPYACAPAQAAALPRPDDEGADGAVVTRAAPSRDRDVGLSPTAKKKALHLAPFRTAKRSEGPPATFVRLSQLTSRRCSHGQ